MADVNIKDIDALNIYFHNFSTLRESTTYNGNIFVSFLNEKLEMLHDQIKTLEKMERNAYKEYSMARSSMCIHEDDNKIKLEKAIEYQKTYDIYIKIRTKKNTAIHTFKHAKKYMNQMIEITYNYQKKIIKYTESAQISLKNLVSNIEDYKELVNLINKKEK